MVDEVKVTFNEYSLQRINECITDDDYMEKWDYFVDDELAFFADRYPKVKKGGYAVLGWRVNPKKDASFYVGKLAGFYHELKKENYTPAGVGDKEFGVIFSSKNETPVHITLTGKDDEDSELENKLLSKENVNFLSFKTPYGDFNFEPRNVREYAKPGGHDNWTPQNGLLGLKTHLHIPDLAVKLIMNTSAYKLSEDKIKPILRRIFTFLSEYKLPHEDKLIDS
ncbi:MAG: hypothetical protein ABIB43_01905 [archaeon]